MTNALKILILFAFFIQSSGTALAETRRYDIHLLRLSEILGSLHYISNLCGTENDEWRDRMSELIKAEKPEDMRLTMLYAAFNDAYRSFSENYHTCTPAAVEAGNLYKKEGAEITKKLISHYAN